MSAEELLARTVATTLETPHAGEMVAQLVESGRDILAEVDAEPAAIGKPLSIVRGERAGLMLGLVHAGQFTLGIRDDPVVAAGDRLLIARAESGERRRAARLPARVMPSRLARRRRACRTRRQQPGSRLAERYADSRARRQGCTAAVIRPLRRPVVLKVRAAQAGCFGGRRHPSATGGAAMRAGIRGLGPPALFGVGSYRDRPEPILFLRILAVSDREDVRGEHRPLN